MLSPAVEDYLKAIYKLQSDGAVATSAIADALDVSSASVTNMAKRLADRQLVEYESYKGVRLTDTGKKIALEIIRHHRLLELYFKEKMGYSWEQLHEEAEHLEHHISEQFEEKIDELLDYPTRDPHGHPIPTPDGALDEPSADALSDVEPGTTVVVQHLSDQDHDLLHYLEDLGLMPQTELTVVDKEPFEGPLTIRIGDTEQVLGHRVASSVFVVPARALEENG